MNLSKRELAPILPEAWRLIDAEAQRVLRLNLAGRKVVDFSGPHGWRYAAVNTGRLQMLGETPVAEVSAGLRRVQPLVELRAPAVLQILELDTVARGAEDPDLAPIVRAAERIARAEDGAIFNGFPQAGITGVIAATPHPPLVAASAADLPRRIAEAREMLRAAGINGPYALALGTALYEDVSAASEDGYPISKRLERGLIDGPIVHAPAVAGGVLLSTRGGDYELTVGQDLTIGYVFHSKNEVELAITESFTFRVLEPAAAVHLRYAARSAG